MCQCKVFQRKCEATTTYTHSAELKVQVYNAVLTKHVIERAIAFAVAATIVVWGYAIAIGAA